MDINKKIAFVIHSLGRGGAEKVVSELSIHLAARGYPVTIIVFDARDTGYPYGGRLLDLSVHSGHGSLRRMLILLKRAFRLRRVYQRESFDTVIAVMESASFPSLLVNRQTIVSNHCNPDLYFSRMEWFLSRLLFPLSPRVVCVSAAAVDVFKYRLPKSTQLDCIYNPVDFGRLWAYAQEKPAVGLQEPYIIAVGRLEQQKRIDRLLQAYARSKVQASHKLLILGEGSLRQTLLTQVRELGLDGRVIMPGNVPNPHPDVMHADFLVLASDHEGFPMVLIEALALGKPVVSTDCATGPNEIIRHEHNGLLVPVDDVPALASAMNRLLEDRQLHAKMAGNAQASIAHLAIERIADRWMEL